MNEEVAKLVAKLKQIDSLKNGRTLDRATAEALINKLDELAALRERLAAVEAERDALRKALSDLRDVQNGPPLPKYEREWSDAMAKANAVLFAAPRA